MLILLIIIPLGVAATVVVVERNYRDRLHLQQYYLRSILLCGFHLERYTNYLSLWGSARAKEAASQVASNLSSLIYKLDKEPLLELDRHLSLGRFLLQAAQRSRGLSRAMYLSRLSALPLDSVRICELKPFLSDSNRMVRFFALLATINIDRANMLEHLASYPLAITPFERSSIMNILRRGAVAITYQPLLASSSYNLNVLGVTLVREFSLEGATQHLYQMLEHTPHTALRLDILYALASMQRLDYTPRVLLELSRLTSLERQRYLRYLVREGYSERMVASLSSYRERDALRSMINSYKISLECY